MLALVLAMTIATMKLWPQTPTARLLHEALVEAPLRIVARTRRKHLFFAAIVILFLMAPAMLGPFDLALYGAWDIAVFLDLATVGLALAAVARGRSALAFVRTWAIGIAARPATRRAQRRAHRTRVTRAANDDDGDGRAVFTLRLAA